MLTDSELRKATLYKSLAKALEAAPEVYKFSLSGTRTALAAIPEDVRQFTKLQVLNASGVPIRSLPSWIGELTNLQELIVDETNVVALPDSIRQLTNLRRLALAFNTSLAAGFENVNYLTNLRTLTINAKTLDAIDITKLLELESLLVEHIGPTTKIAPIWKLTKLKKLELCGDGTLPSIPEGIGALSNLESLSFLATHLRQLPAEIAHLPKLKSLGFSGLGLITPQDSPPPFQLDTEQFFNTISACTKLREIDLSGNVYLGIDHTTVLIERLSAALPKLVIKR